MMKKTFIIALLCISTVTFAQNKYITKTGTLTFEASVPSFEEVKATNKAVTAILNEDNSEFAALALVKAFRFKNALMEEHFNENYAESDTYSKATFKGKINNNSIDGELSFHGKTKTIENIALKRTTEDDIIILTGSFQVNVSDFDIKIPKVVRNKLSEVVDVSFEFRLKKK